MNCRAEDVTEVLPAREYALMLALVERPGPHPVAFADRRAHLRVGRGSRKQRRRRPDPFDPAQVRQGRHSQCPGRGMDGPEVMTASLRRAALLWMTGLLTVVGLVTILIAYVLCPRTRRRNFSTASCARSRSTPGTGMSAGNAPAAADQDPEDQFAITIWDARGRVVHQSLPDVDIPRQNQAGLCECEGRRRAVARLHDQRRQPHGAGRPARNGSRRDHRERGASGPPRRS